MSRAKDALARVLEAVATETDVAAERIMSRCGDAETVDARWICVKILSEHGYYPARIAELMGITPRYVQYIITDFSDRMAMSAMMRTNCERARKNMRNIVEKGS